MSVKKFPLMKNNINRSDLEPVIQLLSTDDPMLTQHKFVKEFEECWSEWLGVKYSVFVNSGASANYISLEILRELKGGGEVILSPINWISDIMAVIRSGFTPVFVDINPSNLCSEKNKILEAVTDKTVAVLMTHIQGFNGLDDELIHFLEGKGIVLLEDVCEAHGATHNNVKCGNFGLMSNFSFYYAHHISSIEGGMICTNDYEIYDMARLFRSHGMLREADSAEFKTRVANEHQDLHEQFIFYYPGYNMRNTEVGALIGLNQLKRIDENVEKRQDNFLYFLSKIDSDKYRTDFYTHGGSNYSFQLILKDGDEAKRTRIQEVMDASGIEWRRGAACGGNHLRQPYLQRTLGEFDLSKYPEADYVHFNGYYLGNYPSLARSSIDWLVGILNNI
jgi:CDP-4-dehydro-6-deoxyglucose reductase, E1